MKDASVAVSIWVSKSTEERIAKLVSQAGRSKAYYLREAVDRGLRDVEDYYLATKVLEDVCDGRERTYSAEELRQELGLED